MLCCELSKVFDGIIHLLETYNEAKKNGKTDVPNWLAKNVDKFYSASGSPKP